MGLIGAIRGWWGQGADKGKYYELNGGKGVDTEKIPVALKNKRTHGDTPCKKA